jgi:uncharacterized damage-inducible protein DinB
MHDVLQEAFRHAAWATTTLVGACRGLTSEQLRRPARGFGSILATLRHVVDADAGYAAILTGVGPATATPDTDDLAALEARAGETARLWARFLAEPFDAGRVLLLDGGTYECRASLVVAQALHHGAAHREQVRAALKEAGVPAPDLQPWAYADATGRSRRRGGGS